MMVNQVQTKSQELFAKNKAHKTRILCLIFLRCKKVHLTVFLPPFDKLLGVIDVFMYCNL